MKVNPRFEAGSPLLNRTALESMQMQEHKESVPTFSLLFNMVKTKARSEIGERVLQRCRSMDRPDPFFRLITEVDEAGKIGYALKANHDEHVVYPNGKYAFVILSSSQGAGELRIGQMHHYYLASKRREVFAAGEIDFSSVKDGPSSIVTINDHSGGYHINDEEDELVRSFKRLSITNVIGAVGLPIDKFCSIDTPKVKSSVRRNSV